MNTNINFCVFCIGQSASSDERLAAVEKDHTDSSISADAESSMVHLDPSSPAGKEFINPRGIRFTTVSSHGLEGRLVYVSTSDNISIVAE